MYLRLLDEAIADLSEEKQEQPTEVYLELEYSGFIPDSYIADPTEKMEVYKMIASITEEEGMERVYAELEDRFGPLPEEVSSLLALAEIRILCRKLYISSLKERNGLAQVEFTKVSKISADKVVRLIKESGGNVTIDPHKPNILLIKSSSVGLKEKSEFLRERLSYLL